MELKDESEIMEQLVRMDPSIANLEPEEQYAKAYKVYSVLGYNWREYALTEMICATTFAKTWFWRKKS